MKAAKNTVSDATIERWLSGRAPTTAHLETMAHLWGEPFVRAVFAEAFQQQDARLSLLERSLQAAGAAIDEVYTGYVQHGLGIVGGLIGNLQTWTGRMLLALELRPQVIIESRAERVALIEGLLRTVPAALPAPSPEPNDRALHTG